MWRMSECEMGDRCGMWEGKGKKTLQQKDKKDGRGGV